MRFPYIRFVGVALFALVLNAPIQGENWPGWRGPRSDGTSLETDLPLKWTATENIAWKVPIPGRGFSSPVIWDDKLFLTTCLEKESKHVTLCLDRKTGKTLWQHEIDIKLQKRIHARNSHASSTPVTDGKNLYVTFFDDPKFVVCCYDLDGKLVWQKSPGEFHSVHGFGCSPLLYKDTVILNGDQDALAYLVALDKTTGAERWRSDRPNRTRSYTPPVIFDIHGKNQLIYSGSKSVTSYDPETGKQIWIINGPTEQYVASLVYHHDVLFMTYGFPKLGVMGINPDLTGDITKTGVLYDEPKGGGYVPSPIAHQDWFFNVDDRGIATCRECKTGKLVWLERLGSKLHSASATGWGDYIYFPDNEGTTFIIKAGPKFELVAKNAIGEPINGSLAISHGHLFLRGITNLY
jgi:outer membrane protein assembly factor BamB